MTPRPCARHRDDAAHARRARRDRRVVRARADEREREEADADADDDDQARDRPARDLRRDDDVEDEQQRPGRGRRRGARRRCRRASPTGPSAAAACAEHGDARELADPSRQHRVREQADRERGEDRERLRDAARGIAWRITVVQASARTTTERRLNPIATTTHSHSTAVNASPIARKLGPRHQRSANDAPHEDASASARAAGERRRRAQPSSRRRGLVDLDQPARDRVPRVPLLRELAAGGAHRRRAAARRRAAPRPRRRARARRPAGTRRRSPASSRHGTRGCRTRPPASRTRTRA